MSSVSPPESFAASNAVQVIQSELSKDVSGTYLLVDEKVVRGYAIATVSEDPIWGRSGWLNPGAFAIQPGYEYALPELYTNIGQEWLDRGILDHHLFLFTPDRVLPPIWTDLGFAKQQTHAMLNLDSWYARDTDVRQPDFRIRPPRIDDADEISTFSRCIASYQAAGPCFAPAPEEYLQALDSGFAALLDDDEAEIHVAEVDGALAGISIIYPADGSGLLLPPGGAELSVAAVKPPYRGNGIGAALIRSAFADQKAKGRSCILTDWRCANPLSSRFWAEIGFKPIGHRLVRRLDSLYSA